MKLSTRARLTLFFSALFAVLLTASMAVLYFRVSRSLHKDFREEMIHDGRIMAELFKEELKLGALDEFEEEIREFGMELQVLVAAGRGVVQSKGWVRTGLAIDEGVIQSTQEAAFIREVEVNGEPMALFSRPVHIPDSGLYSLHFVRSEAPLRKTTQKLLHWMFFIAPLMVLLSAIAGCLFSTRTLAAEQKAFERLKNFTADAAHELRIPLTSLRGSLEVALRKDRSSEEYRETVAAALEEAEHLSELTQDLFLLAQTDANQLKLNVQEVRLKPFLEEALSLAAGLPDEKHIQIRLDPAPDATVRFDPDRMKQLLLNLIDNGIKYGVPNGWIRLTAEISGGRLKLVVQDNGIGIPKSEQERIFERFYRVDKARSRQTGGAGLGLSIVRWIAQAHGGRVQVESQEGKGTTFTVTIPLLASFRA